jgi:hypothetical protein
LYDVAQLIARKAKMEIYEPLKPPEIERDGMGRFERRGKGDLIKNPEDIKRDPGGRFTKGHGGARAGAGRPPGAQNKISLSLKQMILAALDQAGGEEGGTGYLRRLAIENSSAFASLLGKVLPTTLAADESSGGASVKMTFERVIVWPDGRREIEGVTPKSLPAPDGDKDQ